MAQIRLLGGQIADEALVRFAAHHPAVNKVEAPPLVKWVVGAIAALGMASIIGGGTWLVSSVGDMKVTLARMDERQQAQDAAGGSRMSELERRVVTLEGYHKEGSR
jgi:hypothetical protein